MHSIQVSQTRRKNSEMDLDAVAGVDILAMFSQWASSLDKAHFKNPTKKHYGTKPGLKIRNRLVVLNMRTGSYGTEGDHVIDTTTHAKSYGTKAEDAQTVETRCAFLVPPGLKIALFFTEKQGHENCGGMVLASFVAHLKTEIAKIKRPDGKKYSITVDTKTVVEPDAWVASAHMESVTAVMHEYNSDIGDATATRPVSMRYTTTLAPVKGTPFLPDKVRDVIFDKKLQAAADLGFPDDLAYDELIVKLGDGEQSKTMVIDNQKTPAIRVLLNDHGEPHLKLSGLISRIDEEAKDFFERRQMKWNYAWTRKP